MKGKFKVFGIVFGLLVSSIPATGVTESKTAQAASNTVTGVRIEFDSNQDISDFWTGLNKTFKLNAVVEPSYAPNKRVTWSSSNPDVVTVDKYGNLFSVGYGYSYITVCTEDGGFTSRLLMKINGFGFNYGDTSCNCLYEADDLADMTKAVSGDTALFSEYQKKAMDLDGDGKITENDLDLMTKAVLGDAPKDSNGVTIFPVEKLINNISVKKLPDKTEYIVGEELDLTGLEVQVQYNSGITKVITDGFTFTGNTNIVGGQTINITYLEDGIEKTTQFNIKVTDNEPTEPSEPSETPSTSETDAIQISKQDIKVTPSKKTINKKKSFSIKVGLTKEFTEDKEQEEIDDIWESDVDSVEYRSSKSSVASVDENGKVKAKKKGKAIIKTIINLADSSEFIYKTTVYVR